MWNKSNFFDIGMFTAFHTVIVHVCIVTAILVVNNGCSCTVELPPRDVLHDVITEFIDRYDVGYILPQQTSSLPSSHRKRKMIDYDRERASKCARSDWFSPTPRFDDKQFERTFRLKKVMVERIVSKLADFDRFWVSSIDCCGKPSIDPLVKFLTAQKMICYGISYSAFKDYCQMGESTARKCMNKLTRGIVECKDISGVYLRYPTKNDAKKTVSLHKKVYGIDGCLGCLDVTKIHWSACPVAWKGQFEGKEGYPTIGLEAVADYNLWIWHNAFGFPGSMNDINIWDRSPLLESMLDGTHENIDFPFTIGSEKFDQLYYLVDGIYPSLSRFLATINDPTTVLDSFFAPKQEGWRKSIERAFGVWKKKFLSVGVKCMLYHREDMFYLAIATIVMHNMMVEERVHNEERESENFYDIGDDQSSIITSEDDSDSTENSHDSSVNDSPDANIVGNFDLSNVRDSSMKYAIVQQRWKKLYSDETSLRLQDAVKKYVFKEHHGDDGTLDINEMHEDYDPLMY